MFRKIFSETNPLRLLYHKFVAVFATTIYGFPASRLNVIGITGTKGKTSSCNFTAMVLEEAGKKVAMATSINFQIGDEKWVNASKKTTLSPFELQSFLKRAVKAGCEYMVMEVSSHAITQSRIWGVNIDTVVLTQIDQDHLEYHGGLEAYVKAKEEVFKVLNGSRRKPNIQKIMILNEEDKYFDKLNQYDGDLKISYGLNKGTVSADNMKLNAEGATFDIIIPNHEQPIVWQVPGIVNISNALLATAVGIAHGVNLNTIRVALEKAKPLQGRLEKIEVGQSYTVIVDYAHTTHSLTKLCELFKPLTQNRLILVFGATGGGRDKAKRPKMGEIADRYADIIILTNDDPYDEDEMQIINDIASGVKREEGQGLWKIVSRKEAIHLALMLAGQGDSVVVAGKGCEEIQVIRGQNLPWDDRKIIKEFLSRIVEIEIDTGEKIGGNVCLEG